MIRQFVIVLLILVANSAFSFTYEDLQQAIKDKGAQWTPQKSYATADSAEYSMGVIESGIKPKVYSDLGNDPEDLSDLPQFHDWRNYQGQQYTPPIRAQGYCGSCVIFAVIGALEIQFNIDLNWSNYNYDFSEQYFLNCSAGSCNGWFVDMATKDLVTNGVPAESFLPYMSGSTGLDYENSMCSGSSFIERGTKNTIIADYDNKNGYDYRINYSIDGREKHIQIGMTRIGGYKDVSQIYQMEYSSAHSPKEIIKPITRRMIMEALLDGPLVTTMSVYEDFRHYKNGIYEHVIGEKAGGHAVVIVGYDNIEEYWIVRNSWGEDWGEGGYFRIAMKDTDSRLGIYNKQLQLGVKEEEVLHFGGIVQNEVLKGTKEVIIKSTNLKAIKLGIKSGSGRILADTNNIIIDKKYAYSKVTIDSSLLHEGDNELFAFAEIGKKEGFWIFSREMLEKTLISERKRVRVINNIPTMSLELDSLVQYIDHEDVILTDYHKLSGRIWVKFNISSRPSLPETLSLFLKNEKGEITNIDISDPKESAFVSWHSYMIPNGKYKLWGEITLGQHKVVSDEIDVAVVN